MQIQINKNQQKKPQKYCKIESRLDQKKKKSKMFTKQKYDMELN